MGANNFIVRGSEFSQFLNTLTLLSVLHRADALMIHGKPTGPAAPVVPITMAVPRSPRPATMGRAGA